MQNNSNKERLFCHLMHPEKAALLRGTGRPEGQCVGTGSLKIMADRRGTESQRERSSNTELHR